MKSQLHIVGVGPGDPELITVKAAGVLQNADIVFTPTARIKSESIALAIGQKYLRKNTRIEEIVFPMTSQEDILQKAWNEAAERIATSLLENRNVVFLTLGDPMLYSTSIYLLRSVRRILPNADVRIIPGVPAFCACSAVTQFPLGEKKNPLIIIPAGKNLDMLEESLKRNATVVIMKVGEYIDPIIDLLQKHNALQNAVLISHATMEEEKIVTDLLSLKGVSKEHCYLSIILVKSAEGAV